MGAAYSFQQWVPSIEHRLLILKMRLTYSFTWKDKNYTVILIISDISLACTRENGNSAHVFPLRAYPLDECHSLHAYQWRSHQVTRRYRAESVMVKKVERRTLRKRNNVQSYKTNVRNSEQLNPVSVTALMPPVKVQLLVCECGSKGRSLTRRCLEAEVLFPTGRVGRPHSNH